MFPNYYLQSSTRKVLDKVSKIFRNIVLPIYWAFLTYMLLKPGTENAEYWFMFSGIDKVLHFSIFAVLGFCLKMAYPKTKFTAFLQIMLCYGFLSEILQDEMHMGRSMEFFDVVADITGSSVGYFIFFKIKNEFFR